MGETLTTWPGRRLDEKGAEQLVYGPSYKSPDERKGSRHLK